MWPGILGQDFLNGILSKYSTRPEGIYYVGMNCGNKDIWLMKPNFRTTMYYNGYTWLHETDRMGFRNAHARTEADILLLGDSYIYGHGVNVESTVPFLLERYSDYTVFNLARQGDCAFQQTYLLNHYIKQIKPKYVVYFFFSNDISDVHQYLTEEMMQEFIDMPLEELEACEITEYSNPSSDRSSLRRQKLIPYVWRWGQMLSFRSKLNRYLDYYYDVESLEWKYVTRAILKMNDITNRNHARFILAPITLSNREHYEVLTRLADTHNIACIDTSLINNLVGSAWFLKNDGHFSAKGASVMAKLVLKFLEKEGS